MWPADTFVDFELGLNTAIKRLRQALGDSAYTPRFVETLHRRGYRFVFPIISGAPPPTAAPEIAPEEPFSEPSRPAVVVTPARRWVAAGLWFVLACSSGVFMIAVYRSVTDVGRDIQSLAVLPLDNLSADPEQEYFADGLTDEIITDLAKLDSVRVISRSSVFRYKHSRKPLREIAKELDVDAVVEGTVMRSGRRVRITAQMIRARNDQHLWADQFEGDTQDVLALQENVARAIATTVQRQLTPSQQGPSSARRRVDPLAYDAFLRGQDIVLHRRTREGLDNAIRDYMFAIDKDPGYAPPYAALADCYTNGMFVSRPLSPRDAWARAAQAATRALLLDGDLAEAHVALATIRFRYDWNWAEADREYKRAIEVNPNSARAYQTYAIFLNLMRRPAEGAAAAQKAEQLDPVSPGVSNVVSLSYAWERRYDDAIRHERKTLELEPGFAPAHNLLARSYEAKGMWAEAVAEWLKTFTAEGVDPRASAELRQAFDTGGIRAFWKKWLTLDEERLGRGERPRLMELARLSYLVGDANASFGWLEEAYQERDPGLPNIYWAADWLGPLRSDPRYLALARRIGLPQ